MKLTTIHTVTYPSEAHVLKMQLEEEGYYVFLKDELTIQTDNFMSNTIGGVKIQVEEERAIEAYDYLDKLGYLNKELEAKSYEKEMNKNAALTPFIEKLSVILKYLIVFLVVITLCVMLLKSL